MESSVLLTIILSFVTLEVAISQSSCPTTEGGEAYECIPSSDCAFVRKLVEVYGRDIPRQIRNQLRQRQCQGNSSDHHICCRIKVANNQKTQLRSDITHYDKKGLEYLNTFRDCGIGAIATRVVSQGTDASLHEFPWIALLKYKTLAKRPFFCGGSLISDRHVLTAAHCVAEQPQVLAVRLGEHDLSQEVDCTIRVGLNRYCQPPYEEYAVELIRVHPNYVHGQISNDIAIVRLKGQVRPNIHIQPVCLPIDAPSQELRVNQDFYIAGWGKTDKGIDSPTLQKATVWRQGLDKCRQFYQKEGELNESHICATGEELRHTCAGDSGSPLFTLHRFSSSYHYVQYGVSLGGQWCGRNSQQPGVFANVINMLPWITQNLP